MFVWPNSAPNNSIARKPVNGQRKCLCRNHEVKQKVRPRSGQRYEVRQRERRGQQRRLSRALRPSEILSSCNSSTANCSVRPPACYLCSASTVSWESVQTAIVFSFSFSFSFTVSSSSSLPSTNTNLQHPYQIFSFTSIPKVHTYLTSAPIRYLRYLTRRYDTLALEETRQPRKSHHQQPAQSRVSLSDTTSSPSPVKAVGASPCNSPRQPTSAFRLAGIQRLAPPRDYPAGSSPAKRTRPSVASPLSDLLKSSLVGRWRISASPLQSLDLHLVVRSVQRRVRQTLLARGRLAYSNSFQCRGAVPVSPAYSQGRTNSPRISADSSHSGQCRQSHARPLQRSPSPPRRKLNSGRLRVFLPRRPSRNPSNTLSSGRTIPSPERSSLLSG